MSLTARDKAELGLPINYITNGGAESTTQGWATYANSAANIPSTGTGGSPSSTWTSSTSSPLQANASFLWTKAGSANRQGEGVAYPFTLNSCDQANVMAITFDYTIVSGTFTASDGVTPPLNDGTTSTNAGNSDLECFIYDVTNGVLIPVSPEVLTASSSNSFKFKAVFQTNPNSTSYRLIIHTATTTTNNFVVKFDNFFVGPQSVSYGAPVTDWASYTPTGTWTSNTSYIGKYRRIGDSLEAIIEVSLSGAPNNSSLNISLPSGLSIDTSKFPSTANYVILGEAIAQQSGASSAGAVVYVDSTHVRVFADNTSGTYANNVDFSNSIPYTFASGDTVFVRFTVPIQGWSSTLQMSNDTDTRVVAASYYVSSSHTVNTGSEDRINFDGLNIDTHAAVTTGGSWVFKTPVSGIYEIFSFLSANSSSNTSYNVQIKLYKNGSFNTYLYAVNASMTSWGASGSALLQLVAGDTLYITINNISGANLPLNTGTPQLCYVDIKRLSGPSAIATTDTVSASYYLASNTSITANTPITWDTKEWDTTDSMSGGRFTCPISGKYLITGTYQNTSNSNLRLYVNGSLLRNIAFQAANNEVTYCQKVIANAGDIIDVRPDGTTTVVGDSAHSTFQITRIGN
jgi:hypothetical protein